MTDADKHNEPGKQWRGRTQGSPAMHRLLIWLLRRWPLWMFYFFAAVFMIPGYLLFTPGTRHALRLYYRHVNIRYSIISLFRSYYNFAKAIIDRFAAYAGKRFDIEMVDNHYFTELESRPGGFVMLGAHEGNYELTGYSLKLRHKPMTALLFGGEVDAVMRGRERLFGGNNINIVAVRPGTIDHVFTLNDALSRGEIVSIPADRTFGSSKVIDVTLCGGQAALPLGPFALAASRCVPAVAVFMIKTGYKRYRLTVRSIRLNEDETGLPQRSRAEAMCRRYASALEEMMREYPYQWYNYFDFWREDAHE